MGERYFTPKLFRFLEELADNNEKPWFDANKPRYEEHLKEPALEFIRDVAAPLAKISPHFVADPRGNGRSLFRIYRDTRFSKDKRPYKTHMGIRFTHEAAKDVHAPGYYLHVAPAEVWVGCGIWHPDSAALGKIRGAILDDGTAWKRARDAKPFRENWELGGDSLKRAPKGVDPEHPLIVDLRRKDFVAGHEWKRSVITGADLLESFTELCETATPFQRFLCRALEIEF